MAHQNFNSAFRFRIYPNTTQKQKLDINFGHSRYVYNRYLSIRSDAYHTTGKNLTYNQCSKDLTNLKKDPDFEWLNVAHSQVLQQALKHLDIAFTNFFLGKAKYPRFKSKHGKQTARYPQGFKFAPKQIYLPKVGWVKIKDHRELKGTAKNVTVSKTKSGNYYVSVLCEWSEPQQKSLASKVGIESGLSHFAILSTGRKFNIPIAHKRMTRRLKIRQRRLRRKSEGSNNRHKSRMIFARTREKAVHQRRDFQHKISHEISNGFGHIAIRESNPTLVSKKLNKFEDNKNVGWSEFVNMVAYKTKWKNGSLIKIDQSFSDNEVCSFCGWISTDINRNHEMWSCEACNVKHDRDINSAINILKQTTVGDTESHAREKRSSNK